ncbi:NAD(P)/FAD-dependent oxidoreductase [Marinicellulosiphila megalodicopiae]|uniref:NAD(P)/FAD-dependent oxidoreductase n=1 Tax=Marinicellulosiphila megalodicopiae TaxID=2724896 RepID=UPI003BB17DAC
MSEHPLSTYHVLKEEKADYIKKIIVIGAGPVGIKFCCELLQRSDKYDIHIFSNEPFEPYNRTKLSSWLAGQTSRESIEIDMSDLLNYSRFKLSHIKIEKIDKRNNQVIDILGDTHKYDHLVIATGARTHVPNISGVNLCGVYTFRNLKDAEHLFSRIARSRHIVVAGGGMLGIETAKSLTKFNTKITLIQQGSHLMNHHLDEYAANLLRNELQKCNIDVIVCSGVREIIGSEYVESVRLFGNKIIRCDTVILCTGIKPNIELARNANLGVGKGIIVNDQLIASNQSIFAIGECSEHRGKVYSVVHPGYEQAMVAANSIITGKTNYRGSFVVNKINVIDQNIFSFGQVTNIEKNPLIKVLIFKNKNVYRKIVLKRNNIIGVIGYGQWEGEHQVKKSFTKQKKLSFWQQLKFKLYGDINPSKISANNAGNLKSGLPTQKIENKER